MNKSKISLPPWRRAVIKVGSGLVAPEGKRVSATYSLDIAGFITQCRNRNKEIILVTSGAVAAGLSMLPHYGKRQLSIPEKQALAAVGQPLVMAHWNKFFDFPCAQLLLTYQGMNERQRFVNAKNTLLELLAQKTLPIINENDTVVVDELKVGDNDNLAAHVAVLAEADILFICTDIDGLYESDPKLYPSAQLLPVVDNIDEQIYACAGGRGSRFAIGGMITKIEAAEKATARGIDTLIVNGTKRASFETLLAGKVCGTIFTKASSPMNAKKHWLLHTLKCKGELFIDDGAQQALIHKGASLLPSGIIDLKGRFKQGDAVQVIHASNVIAKGICQYDAHDLSKILGVKSQDIENILGYIYTEEVIHRNDMVILEQEK